MSSSPRPHRFDRSIQERFIVAFALCLAVTLTPTCGGGGQPTMPTDPQSPPLAPASTGPAAPPLSCPVRAAAHADTTYYVATNEPGADNEACDGLSPVDRGSGHCPFRDFLSARTFRLLRDVASLRVEVRAGIYTFQGEGLTIQGTGTNDAERIVLTAYQDESVVFDGENRLRELFRLSGRYTTIERLTFRNAGAYNVEIRGGNNHHIQCNRFRANFLSDSLKGDAGAAETFVRNNDFAGWNSQAIDMTDVSNWTIENNDFHDPLIPGAYAVGAKFGSRGVRVVANRFRNSGGISFGGVSSAHSNRYEAFDLLAERNSFESLESPAIKFYSCSRCSFVDNDVVEAPGGIFLTGERFEGPSGCTGGCLPSRETRVLRNRFKNMLGGPEGDPDTFWGLSSTEIVGLSAGQNVYCVPAIGSAKFQIDDRTLGFAEWTRAVGADFTSMVVTNADGACAF